MPQKIYRWQGIDATGNQIAGHYLASNKTDALTQLNRHNIVLTSIKRDCLNFFVTKLTLSEISLFFYLLLSLLKSSIPLYSCLDIMIRDSRNRYMKLMISSIQSELAQGHPLHSALARYPHLFCKFTVNVLKTTEHSGKLLEGIKILHEYYSKKMVLRKTLKNLSYYPLFVFMTACASATVLLFFVMPQFASLFDTFEQQLPLSTQMMIKVAIIFKAHLSIIILLFSFIPAASFFVIKKSTYIRCKLDALWLKLPVLNTLIRKINAILVLRLLSISLASGVSIIDTLTLIAATLKNSIYANALIRIRMALCQGQSLHYAFMQTRLFSSLTLALIAAAEETGSIEKMFAHLATQYQEELEQTAAAFGKLVEPLIIGFLGLLIGFFVYTMYLPIFKLGSL